MDVLTTFVNGLFSAPSTLADIENEAKAMKLYMAFTTAALVYLIIQDRRRR